MTGASSYKGQVSTPDNPCGSKLMLWIRDVALTHQSDDCLIWPFTRLATGYGRLGRNGKQIFVHRYICEWVNGPPPEPHYHAAHSCGNGHLACVNIRHLRWATPTDNQRDGRRYARRLGMAKAREIRSLKGNLREDVIASRFGISERTVRRIHYGEIWTGAPRKDGKRILP